jgi:hypothetical protein
MKKLALTLCLAALTTGAFAQGLVNFNNNATTLVSAGGATTPTTAGAYYYGLFTAPLGTTDYNAFTFAGLYGTNQATAGRFSGGVNQPITGWAPGTSRSFYVLGWSAEYGRDAQGALSILNAGFGPVPGFAGHSIIASGVGGGFDGTANLPALALFTTLTINQGWNMAAIPVIPEPTSFALAGFGAAALLIFRRRK